jgi:hypothetical protein
MASFSLIPTLKYNDTSHFIQLHRMYGLLILYFRNVLSLYYVVVFFLLVSGSSNCIVVTELRPTVVCVITVF